MQTNRRSALKTLALASAAPLLPGSPVLAQPQPQASLQDPLRPGFHYLPERNWMNDPCGPLYFQGKYHLFHQYNPHGALWGDMHWDHAVSPDMVHWQRLAVALSPTPGGPDSEGCFTGTAILDHGRPTFLYTGIRNASRADATLVDEHSSYRESQCLAIATDGTLTDWKKLPAPVIPAPPAGMKVTGFRDPSPWREGISGMPLSASESPARVAWSCSTAPPTCGAGSICIPWPRARGPACRARTRSIPARCGSVLTSSR